MRTDVVTEKEKNMFGAFVCNAWKEKFISANLSCGKYALELSRKLFTFLAQGKIFRKSKKFCYDVFFVGQPKRT